MKVLLIVLILCFFFNLTSAFPWFSFLWNQQANPSTNTHRSTSHSQRSTHEQNHLRNVTGTQRQAVIASNKNSTNRLPPQRVINRQQHHLTNTTTAYRQADSINRKSNERISNTSTAFREINYGNNNTNKQITYVKYRPFSSLRKNNTIGITPANRRVLSQDLVSKSTGVAASTIFKKNIQSFRSRSSVSKSTVKNTKVGLLRSLATKTTGNNSLQNRRRLQPASYYQQRLRAFYQSQKAKNTAHNHSTPQAPLRQRKRQNDIPSASVKSMIYSRDAPYTER